MSALLQPRIVIGTTTIIILLILFSLGQEMSRRWQVEREVARLEVEAGALKKSVTELENLNQYFKTSDFQERLAREKLNYRAPGEEVVLVPDDSQLDEEVVGSQLIDRVLVVATPMKWWNAFFGASLSST